MRLLFFHQILGFLQGSFDAIEGLLVGCFDGVTVYAGGEICQCVSGVEIANETIEVVTGGDVYGGDDDSVGGVIYLDVDDGSAMVDDEFELFFDAGGGVTYGKDASMHQ